MNFLDKIGGKPSPLNLAKSNIESINQQISDTLKQLGMEMYKRYLENGAEGFSEYIPFLTKLDQLEANRKSFYSNYLQLQGMMECRNCKSIIPYGSVFCSKCGCKAAEQDENFMPTNEQVQVAIRCQTCGNEVSQGAAFCKSCGTKVAN